MKIKERNSKKKIHKPVVRDRLRSDPWGQRPAGERPAGWQDDVAERDPLPLTRSLTTSRHSPRRPSLSCACRGPSVALSPPAAPPTPLLGQRHPGSLSNVTEMNLCPLCSGMT